MSGLQGVRAVRGAAAKERQVQQLWDNTPNDLDEQAKYNLAIDFINLLKKRTDESYLEVDTTKGFQRNEVCCGFSASFVTSATRR